jgi:hypothetical protein
MAAVNASNLTEALMDPLTTWTILAPTDEVRAAG